ncbi:MAG TPA: outer membrane beta-barrel protein, partial [Ignavibacteriaceae bacterium]
MKQFSITILYLIILFTPFQISAQDSTETEDDEWKWDDEWKLEWEEEWMTWSNKKPTLSLNYGFSDISRTDVEAPISDNNLFELKLGYTYKKTTKYSDDIEKSTFNYGFLNRNSTELAGSSETNSDIETDNWQFGLGWSGGYGYKLGAESAVTPYYTSSFTWTNLDFADDSLSPNDERIKQLYDETFRFGSSYETGVRVQATSLIALEGGYERSIVFERHLFWKWAGSEIIEIASHGVLDVFIKEVFKSSPSAGPIVFVL